MGFDPNEPRDALGRWTDSISSATRAAASDQLKRRKGFQTSEEHKTSVAHKTIEEQQQEIADLLNIDTTQVNINNLSQQQANDLVEVLTDITENGHRKVPISSVSVCNQSYGIFSGTSDWECVTNAGAGAWYSFNWEHADGWLHINPDTVEKDFTYKPDIPSYDERIAQLQENIKNLNDENWVREQGLTQDDVKLNLDNFSHFIDHFQTLKKNNIPPVIDNFSLQIKDDSQRFKSIVYHEIGHMELKKKYIETHPDVTDEKARSQDYKEWRSAVLTDNAKYEKGIWEDYANSEYGKSNGDEFFAEWYASYKLGKGYDKAPKPIKDLINEIGQ